MFDPTAKDYALAFYAEAVSYMHAADRLYLGLPRTPDFLELHEPRRFLINHSVELALKSFLLVKGHGLSQIRRKGLGHDLKALFEKAASLGLDEWIILKESVRRNIEHWNRLNSPGEYAIRYPSFEMQPANEIEMRNFGVDLLMALLRFHTNSPSENVEIEFATLENLVRRNTI